MQGCFKACLKNCFSRGMEEKWITAWRWWKMMRFVECKKNRVIWWIYENCMHMLREIKFESLRCNLRGFFLCHVSLRIVSFFSLNIFLAGCWCFWYRFLTGYRSDGNVSFLVPNWGSFSLWCQRNLEFKIIFLWMLKASKQYLKALDE